MLELVSQRELPVVMLIDDDLVSREVTATLLTLNGYTVHTAESGQSAVRMLQAGVCQPSVILSDAQMPGLSGAELIGKLRTACKRASIYLISGSQPAEDLVQAADGLLLKPFDAAALRALLEEGRHEGKAETFLAADEPVVNREILAQLRQMMPEKAVREIYAAVVADLQKRTEALGAAIARHDRAEVRRIGHAIKGGCGMAGAMQAARLGALLEAEPLHEDDNQLDNSRILLNDLRAAIQSLQRILDHELPA